MKYIGKYSLIILVIGLVFFNIVGCTFKQIKPLETSLEVINPELEVWIFFDHNTPGTHYIDLWETLAKELGYTVNIKTFATEELKDKLRISLACGELPDIFAVWGGTFPDFLFNADACLPVQDYISNSGLKFKESYSVPYSDGNNYIIPCLVEAYAVTFCNNLLMEEIGVKEPKTWDELLDLVYSVNEYNKKYQTNYAAIELGDKDNWSGELLYNMIVNRIDPYALEKLRSGELDFTDKVFLDAAYKVVELVDADAFSKGYLETGEVESIQNFIQNKSVLFPHQSTLIYHLMENMGEDSIDLIQWPDCDSNFNEDYKNYLIDINHTLTPGLCISSKTPYKDQAAEICLKFSQEVNKINVTQYGYIDFMESDNLTPPDDLPVPVKEFTSMVEDAKYLTSYWYAILPQNEANKWRNLTKRIFAKAITPEEFIEEGAQYLTYLPKVE
jgi:raffinose/stachyose/melibiose transport system substrate-binding protein